MTFASIEFLFYFFPLFLVCYFSAKTIATRNVIFLAFSLVFYAAGYTPHLLLLLFSVAANFVFARKIDDFDAGARRRWLVYGVTFNLMFLGVFKYTDFMVENLNLLLPDGIAIPLPRIALPLGISFYSFHAISYLADIYKGRVRANRDPVQFALYMCMFPQLVAGPIVRYSTVAKQLGHRRVTPGRFSAGARLFVIGLAWKALIADELARLVEGVFDTTTNPTFVESWLAAYSYTLQIYFDFAGYSTMAVGLGIMVGFALPRNFRIPYATHSISEFWRCWHMSLSAFLRDYLYIPLGGKPEGALAHLCQPRHRLRAVRPVARGELEFRHLGRLSRRFPDHRAGGAGQDPRPAAAGAGADLHGAGGAGGPRLVPRPRHPRRHRDV